MTSKPAKSIRSISMLGNTNTVKWTEDNVVPILLELVEEAQDDKYMTLGELLLSRGLYKQIFQYWLHKFDGNQEITHLLNFLKGIFEEKLLRGGLSNQYNVAATIFILKNNFGYSDRQDISLGVHRDDLDRMTDEELSEKLEQLKKANGQTT